MTVKFSRGAACMKTRVSLYHIKVLHLFVDRLGGHGRFDAYKGPVVELEPDPGSMFIIWAIAGALWTPLEPSKIGPPRCSSTDASTWQDGLVAILRNALCKDTGRKYRPLFSLLLFSLAKSLTRLEELRDERNLRPKIGSPTPLNYPLFTFNGHTPPMVSLSAL